jgi:hypothetical protein
MPVSEQSDRKKQRTLTATQVLFFRPDIAARQIFSRRAECR